MKRQFVFAMAVLLLGTVGALGAYSYHSSKSSKDRANPVALDTDFSSTFSNNYWQHALQDTLEFFSPSSPDTWLWDDPLNEEVRPPLAPPEDSFNWDAAQSPMSSAFDEPNAWQDTHGLFSQSSPDAWLWDDPFNEAVYPPLALPEDSFNWDDIFNPEDASPQADIEEKEDTFIVRLAAPAIEEKSIEVKVEADQRLRIIAETETRQQQAAAPQQAPQGFKGRFERTLSLPGPIDATQIQSEYVDGVLKVKVPKVRHS